jgi:ribosome maturation factor RimP
MADIAALTALIEPEAEALGLKIVRVAMFGGVSDPTLQVMAERPDTRQLVLEDCAELSRRLSDVFDAADPIDHAYRLEVSSPGIDRPLTRFADYDDWAGFDARLRLGEAQDGRKVFEGRLVGTDPDGDDIWISVDRLGEVRVPFAAIRTAKLLLTDELIKATAPLSSEGADKIQVEG